MKKLSLTIIAVFIACIATVYAADPPRDQTPLNFIIIFADDLGYGDLGVYGHPSIQTPHLDQIAMEGQKWTNFYVGASVCTPSRAALLTGRLPVRSGMASNAVRVLFPDSHHGLPQSEITIAEQLKKVGYSTGCIGKWHLGHKKEYLPTNNGFDSYYGIPYSNDMDVTIEMKSMLDYMSFWKSPESKKTESFNVPLIRNTEIIERPADQNTITKRYTEEALKFIQEHSEKPFFLYLAHSLPHVPLFASKEFLGKSARGLYGDVVEEIDNSVGQVVNALKEKGIAENTILVFTSDNGPWLLFGVDGGSAGQLRDGKGTTWEGGMREPCIFWSPGNIKPKVVTGMGTTMDLFTTFSKMAGVEIPDDRIIDGLDLSPVLLGDSPSPRREIFYYRGVDLYAVRLGAYKAHFITEGGYGPPKREEHSTPLLYNVETDPSELHDISKSHPEVIKQIQEVVDKHNSKLIRGEDQLKERG